MLTHVTDKTSNEWSHKNGTEDYSPSLQWRLSMLLNGAYDWYFVNKIFNASNSISTADHCPKAYQYSFILNNLKCRPTVKLNISRKLCHTANKFSLLQTCCRFFLKSKFDEGDCKKLILLISPCSHCRYKEVRSRVK